MLEKTTIKIKDNQKIENLPSDIEWKYDEFGHKIFNKKYFQKG